MHSLDSIAGHLDYLAKLEALENAIEQRNNDVRFFTPSAPIIGIASDSTASFIDRPLLNRERATSLALEEKTDDSDGFGAESEGVGEDDDEEGEEDQDEEDAGMMLDESGYVSYEEDEVDEAREVGEIRDDSSVFEMEMLDDSAESDRAERL